MGGAVDNTWRTALNIGLYSGDSGLDTSRLSLRTGPSLSIDGLAFGARLQPYVEALHVADDDDDVDYTSLSLGARYQNTHGENWSSFADLKFGKLDGDIEGDTWAALVGASYTPSRDTRVRFLVSMSDRDADVPAESRERQTARVELRRAFSSPNGKGRRWVGSAFAQIDTLDYDSGREDRLTSVGVSLRAFVNDDVFIQAGLRNIDRDSNDDSLDDSTPLFSLSIGRVF